MLINIRISELESNTRNSMLLAINIILLFNYSFSMVALSTQPYTLNMFNSSSNVYVASNYGNEWAQPAVALGASPQHELASSTLSLNTENIYYVSGSL